METLVSRSGVNENKNATVLTLRVFNRYSGFTQKLPTEWAGLRPTNDVLYQLSYNGNGLRINHLFDFINHLTYQFFQSYIVKIYNNYSMFGFIFVGALVPHF